MENNEIIVTEIKPNPQVRMAILTCYKSQTDDHLEFLSNFELTLKNCIQTGFTDLLVLGDFNFHDIKWKSDKKTGISDSSKQFFHM